MAIRARFREAELSVCDLTPDTAGFAKKRASRTGGLYTWPDEAEGESLPAGAFGTATCLFRLEALPPEHRAPALAALFRTLAPGGKLVLGYCNRTSYHSLMERARRGRLGGVEYVLAPEPHLGPFETLTGAAVRELARGAGFRVVGQRSFNVLPDPKEAEFRARNLSGPLALVGRLAGGLSRVADALPGAARLLGRMQFLCLEKPS
jgi:SAM-dependent methyltransferase